MHRRRFSPVSAVATFVALALTLSTPSLFSAQKKKRKVQKPAAEAAGASLLTGSSKVRAVRKEGPNVLLIIAHDLKKTDANAQNSTPNLDRLTQLGVKFSNAYATHVLSNPARISFLTGMYPWKNGVDSSAQDWRWSAPIQGKETLPALMYQSGFFTAAAGEIFPGTENNPLGFDQSWVWDARFPAETDVSKNAESGNAKTVQWTEEFLKNHGEGPFFLAVGLSASEETYDEELGKVVAALEKSRFKDDTVIVFLGDHSANVPRTADTKILERAALSPLIVIAPKVTKPNTESSAAVSLVDVYPTLCDLLQLPKPTFLDGDSLVSVLKDPAAQEGRFAVTTFGGEKESHFAVHSDRLVYLQNHNDTTFYDQKADPELLTNLATQPEQSATKEKYAALLPQTWASAHRAMQDVKMEAAADGSAVWTLYAGDNFPGSETPDIAERGLDLEIIFDYNPKVDNNALLLSFGDPQLGLVIHLVDGKAAFTVNYDGLRSTLKYDAELPASRVTLRALLGIDGSLALGTMESKAEVRGFAPMDGGFPRKPEGALQVGHARGALFAKDFPNNTAFHGAIQQATLRILPGVTEELRAAKAVPVE